MMYVLPLEDGVVDWRDCTEYQIKMSKFEECDEGFKFYAFLEIEPELKKDINFFSSIMQLVKTSNHFQSIVFAAVAYVGMVNEKSQMDYDCFVEEIPDFIHCIAGLGCNLYVFQGGNIYVETSDYAWAGHAEKFVQLLNGERIE